MALMMIAKTLKNLLFLDVSHCVTLSADALVVVANA
jgi:hypothetical protein